MFAVYRAYDASGTLLYVGATMRLPVRVIEQARSKKWWVDVARIDVAWFDTLAGADEAETVAIATEGPAYNREGVTGPFRSTYGDQLRLHHPVVSDPPEKVSA